jgi:hypothetical protein
MSDLEVLGRHALVVAAALALAGTGWRVAARAGLEGLPRAIAAASLAWTLAVLEALVLGTQPVLLAAVAITGWLVVHAVVADRGLALHAQLAAWWRAQGRGGRAAAGAAVAAVAAWIVWQLRFPHVGVDGLTYHLALVASWLPEGDVGAPNELIQGVPVGNYPLTHEVGLTWMTALAGSWAPAIALPPLLIALLAASGWTGLRALGADRLVAALATVAVAALPLAVAQLNAVGTDLAALTWLAACGALAAVSVHHPRALPFAVLAAGLAVGTKTTAVVLAGLVVLLAAWALRRTLVAQGGALIAATAAAAGTAAVWPIRNLVDHGSPLWPFQAWPGGDPVPAAFAAIDDRFLDHPGELLDGRVDAYLGALGGGALLLLGGLLLPLAARTRAALVAGAVVLLAFVAWMNAPYTGILENTDLAIGATRYLLPCLAAAAVAVAVGARGRLRPVALAVLAVAAGWSLVRSAGLGFPTTPNLLTVAVPAGAGAVLAAALPAPALRPLLLATPLAATAVLALAAPGLVERHARVDLPDAELLRALAERPGFTDGDGRTVAMAPSPVALAAGAAVQHALRTIPPGEPCSAVRRRVGQGWVVVQIGPLTREAVRLATCLEGVPIRHADDAYVLYGR